MEASHFFHNLSSDDTLDMLKQFLPEIEHQLRQQIQPSIAEQFAIKRQHELQQIQLQAEKQYINALQTLQIQFQQLKQQKQSQLQTQVFSLQQELVKHSNRKKQIAQQRFMQEHFENRILTHLKMQELAAQLQTQIAQNLLQKFENARDKKAKELRVRIESREQRQRNQLDKAIRAEIYAKSGLEELRQEVKNFKISLASLKSKYNIKINAITKEIQEINKKCKEAQHQNSDLILNQIQEQINSLKIKLKNRQQASVRDSSFNDHKPQITHNFTKNASYNLDNHSLANYAQNQYLHQDIDLDSSESVESQLDSLEQQADSDIPMPPQASAQLNQFLSQPQYPLTADNQSNDIYLQIPPEPLLRFDIAKMLREQWKEDDFDRYIQNHNHKQNKPSVNNYQTSNFNSLYQQHLDKLNRNTRPKMRKLSEKAKQQILNNLAAQHRKRQQYVLYE